MFGPCKIGIKKSTWGGGGEGEDGVYHISGVSGGLERASKYMSNKKIFFCRSPKDVHQNPTFQHEVFDKYMKRKLEINARKKQKIKYHLGQTVRVQYARNKMTRSYNEQAGSQRYVIHRIDTISRLYPLYYLKDERGVLLKGGAFLQSQLVPIRLSDKYRGTVLETFKKKGKKYAKMKFKGYADEWNEDVLI